MARIAVAEMIEELRRELKTAVDAGKGEEICFELGEVTIEAQVEVKKKGRARPGSSSGWPRSAPRAAPPRR